MPIQYTPSNIAKLPEQGVNMEQDIFETENTEIAITYGYNNMNTHELLDAYLDKHLDQQMLDIVNDDEKIDEIEKHLEVIQSYMLKKIESIEHVMIRKDLALGEVKSAKSVYKDHLDFLIRKEKAITRAWGRLEELIITLVENIGEDKNNKKYLTKDSLTYCVYDSPGTLEITNESEVPDRYLKLETKMDKARLRKDIIKDGNTDYAAVPRKKRLKIK